MKKITAFLMSIIMTLSFSAPAFAAEDKEEPTDIVMQDEISLYEPQTADISVLPDGSAYVNSVVTVFFKDGALSSEIKKIFGFFDGIAGFTKPLNLYQFRIRRSSYEDIQKLCDCLMDFSCVELAVPSFANRISDQMIPDDPWGGSHFWSGEVEYSTQWWIRATETDKAWDYGKYFNHIKVGVVDSGVDTEHEDLAGTIKFAKPFLERTNIPANHGTHVCGIIGATHNNKTGISGIVPDCDIYFADWEPDASAEQLWFTDERIFTGFACNVMAGAKAVNFSLGSSGTIFFNRTQRFQIAIDTEALIGSYVISKLLSKGYDFLAVQSAGNGITLKDGQKYAIDAINNGTFSCITPENAVSFFSGVTKQDIVDRIVIVGSAQYVNSSVYQMSSFSNGGDRVSIYAPGSGIYSTGFFEELTEPTHSDYCYLSGTSMAAPVVTGIASLVWSVNPDLTGPQIKKIICDEKNTPVVVKDNTEETHLPTGDGRMINAKLSVEDAISRLSSCGEISGRIKSGLFKRETPYVITSIETGETYRGRTDSDGNFTKTLPEGRYTIKAGASGKSEFTVKAGEKSAADSLKSASGGNAFVTVSEGWLSRIVNEFFRLIADAVNYIFKI